MRKYWNKGCGKTYKADETKLRTDEDWLDTDLETDWRISEGPAYFGLED